MTAYRARTTTLPCLDCRQLGSAQPVPDDELADVQRHLDRLAEIRLQHDLSPEQQDEYEALAQAEEALILIDRLPDRDCRSGRRLSARG